MGTDTRLDRDFLCGGLGNLGRQKEDPECLHLGIEQPIPFKFVSSQGTPDTRSLAGEGGHSGSGPLRIGLASQDRQKGRTNDELMTKNN